MYALVEDYFRIGNHRTGTDVDSHTRDWFMSELRRRGAEPRTIDYRFPGFDVHAEVTTDQGDDEIETLYYSFQGSVDTRDVAFDTLVMQHNWIPTDLDKIRARHQGRGALVLATTGAVDATIVPNRDPSATVGVPTFLASPSRAAALQRAAEVRLRAVGRRRAMSSANVVATLGRPASRTVMVTTPLTGWYGAAGERGTGIALLLDAVEPLAERFRVLVVGTTGHELGHLGANELLRRGLQPKPAALLHLGASAAAGDPTPDGALELSRLRTLSWSSGYDAGLLAEAAAAADLQPVTVRSDAAWIGEPQTWAPLHVPMLSITGTFDRFHTQLDTPQRSTSAAMLDRTASALRSAASVLG